MNIQLKLIKKISVGLIMVLTLLGYTVSSSAHGGGATMDIAGVSRTFTGVAPVSCFDDGNGPAENLIARVRDNSPPQPGLLVNLQVFKGNKAVNITDTESGDADYSPFVTLHGGPGVYYLIVNKTDAGARNFSLEWHCNTIDGIHTGTDTSVSQFN